MIPSLWRDTCRNLCTDRQQILKKDIVYAGDNFARRIDQSSLCPVPPVLRLYLYSLEPNQDGGRR